MRNAVVIIRGKGIPTIAATTDEPMDEYDLLDYIRQKISASIDIRKQNTLTIEIVWAVV